MVENVWLCFDNGTQNSTTAKQGLVSNDLVTPVFVTGNFVINITLC